jgi:hypothetical protein
LIPQCNTEREREREREKRRKRFSLFVQTALIIVSNLFKLRRRRCTSEKFARGRRRLKRRRHRKKE